MLINLETAHLATPKTSAVLTEAVEVKPRSNQHREYLAVADGEWGWRELRDYVVDQIERRHGVFPRNSKVEYGIFSRFVNTFGADAARVARFAFESMDGFWMGAPISVQRFCKGSDAYFARPILEQLNEASE